jgi:hypothetical protein
VFMLVGVPVVRAPPLLQYEYLLRHSAAACTLHHCAPSIVPNYRFQLQWIHTMLTGQETATE